MSMSDELDDAALLRSLAQRISGQRPEGQTAPLGPDDLTADKTGPQDVVRMVMDAFAQGADLESRTLEGCRVLLSFAASVDDNETCDFLGQVQPGAFGDPAALVAFLSSEPNYRTLATLGEWKESGGPETSNYGRSCAQKLLVRRDGSDWEQMYMNMQLCDTPHGKRWIVMTIFKHDSVP